MKHQTRSETTIRTTFDLSMAEVKEILRAHIQKTMHDEYASHFNVTWEMDFSFADFDHEYPESLLLTRVVSEVNNSDVLDTGEI